MEFKNQKLEKFEEHIKNKKIAVIGVGVSNIPLIDYLFEKEAKVTIFDDREEEKISKDILDKIKKYKFDYYFGKRNLDNLHGYDIIFRSPSCLPTKPELVREKERGAVVTTEIEQLIKMAPCKVIGITGSDGKTTTTTLTAKILEDGGYNVYLGGNLMKKQFLAIICSAFFMLGIGSTASAAEVYQPAATSSVATINYQYVLANMPESKTIQQSMAKLSEEAQKDFEKSVNEKMNPEEIQKVRIRVATDLRQKQIDLVKPVQEKINNAIQQVAQQHGYTVVVGSDVVLYTSVDITDEVLNAIK